MQRALRSVLDRLKERVAAPRAGRRLRERASRVDGDVGGLVDLSLGFRYRSVINPWPFKPIRIRALQVPQEFRDAASYLADAGVRRVLEVGTSSGGTLFVWSWLAGPEGFTVSLDLPEGEYAGSQPLGNEGYPHWRSVLYEAFVPPGHRLHLLKGDSHSDEMLQRVRRVAGDEPFDFLFIDGDHSYEGCKRDFEMYSPLVKEGGHVGFHDIVVRPPHTRCEVDRFWREVKVGRTAVEFVQDWEQGWGGIGIVTV